MVFLARSGSLLSWILIVLDPYCPGSLLSWFHIVLVAYCPGSLLSLIPIVLDPSCPGSILSWFPFVLDPFCPGSFLSWILFVLDPFCPGSFLPCLVRSRRSALQRKYRGRTWAMEWQWKRTTFPAKRTKIRKKIGRKIAKKNKNCIFRVVIRAFEKLLVWIGIDTVFSWQSCRNNRFWPNPYI